MQTETIFSTLLDAAKLLKNPFQGVAGQALRDAYNASKSYLGKKFAANPDAARALEFATEKPESSIRKALLVEDSTSSALDRDSELARLIASLAALLPPPAHTVSQNVRVTGHRNVVQVAGRDLIRTEKIVRRNTITPDERHLTVEQRERLARCGRCAPGTNRPASPSRPDPISIRGASAPQPAAGAETGGRDERNRAGSRSVPAKWWPAETDGGRKRGASPSLRARAARCAGSTMARRNSAARRVSVEVGNRRNQQRAFASFPPERRPAPVDAARHATRAVSHLRKFKRYALA
jgi:hypothetical protein